MRIFLSVLASCHVTCVFVCEDHKLREGQGEVGDEQPGEGEGSWHLPLFAHCSAAGICTSMQVKGR
jgi:hypothetical protein